MSLPVNAVTLDMRCSKCGHVGIGFMPPDDKPPYDQEFVCPACGKGAFRVHDPVEQKTGSR